jgi:hypothetical protein
MAKKVTMGTTKIDVLERGKLHFIGHRELGILMIYQFRNKKNGQTKLKIANISREEIVSAANGTSFKPAQLFAEIGRYLADVSMTLDYKNGITDKVKDKDKLGLISEKSDTVLGALLTGQTVSDADFSFVVDVDNNNEGGFSMTRMSSDGGRIAAVLAAFSSLANPNYTTALSAESLPGNTFPRKTAKSKAKTKSILGL